MKLFAIPLAVFVFASCSSQSEDLREKAKPLPSPTAEEQTTNLENGLYEAYSTSAQVEPGTPYKFKLYSHCGIDAVPIDFDGSFWDYESGVGSPTGSAPEGFDDPFDWGVLTLTGDNEMEFDNRDGGVATFTRHEGPKKFGVCA